MSVTLCDVTAENWWQIVDLRVGEEQQSWVAPNVFSLAESKYGSSGKLAQIQMVPLAIYHDEEPVGFLMYNVGPLNDRFFVMRLMIDLRHQGKGYRACMVWDNWSTHR